VKDIIDQMVVKTRDIEEKQLVYKKRILNVSIWSEDDARHIKELRMF